MEDLKINAIDEDGETKLIKAVKAEAFERVDELLRVGADPNVPDADGRVPLYFAITEDQLRIAELLLNNKANPNIYNPDAGYNSNLVDTIEIGSVEMVKLLLRHGAKVADYEMEAQVLVDMMERNEREMFHILLDAGFDFLEQPDDKTVLASAVLNDDPFYLKELIAHGADIPKNNSLLDYTENYIYMILETVGFVTNDDAVWESVKEKINLLLKAGLDPSNASQTGTHPKALRSVINYWRNEISKARIAPEQLRHVDEITKTLERYVYLAKLSRGEVGIDFLFEPALGQMGKWGANNLMAMAYFGYRYLVLNALNMFSQVSGIRVYRNKLNSQDSFGNTALHYAADMAKDPVIVDALIEAGLNPNIQNNSEAKYDFWKYLRTIPELAPLLPKYSQQTMSAIESSQGTLYQVLPRDIRGLISPYTIGK